MDKKLFIPTEYFVSSMTNGQEIPNHVFYSSSQRTQLVNILHEYVEVKRRIHNQKVLKTFKNIPYNCQLHKFSYPNALLGSLYQLMSTIKHRQNFKKLNPIIHTGFEDEH